MEERPALNKAPCFVLWGINKWLISTLPCMFYSNNLVPVLVLVMLSGVALLVLGKPESHWVNSVQTSHTLTHCPSSLRTGSSLTSVLSCIPMPFPLSQCPSWSHSPDLSGPVVTTMLLCLASLAALFCLSLLFWAVLSDSSYYFLFSLWLSDWFTLIIPDEPAYCEKHKSSNDLLPLCPLLFIPGNKTLLQELLPCSWG